MANFSKWAQPVASHRPKAGPGKQQQFSYGSQDLAAQSPFGVGSSPFNVVAAAQSQSGGGDGFSGMSTGSGPSVQAMMQKLATPPVTPVFRPGAIGGGSANGVWNGQYGAVPDHGGWVGLKDPAKEMTLRLLGQFPDLTFASGLRSPERNAAVGGVPNSGHLRGWKVDISNPNKTGNWKARLQEAHDWVAAMGGRPYLHDAGSGYHLDISWEGVRL